MPIAILVHFSLQFRSNLACCLPRRHGNEHLMLGVCVVRPLHIQDCCPGAEYPSPKKVNLLIILGLTF